MMNEDSIVSAERKGRLSVLNRIKAAPGHFGLSATLTFAILMGCVALLPRKYESEAKLLVNSERPDLIITPSDTKTDANHEELIEVRLYSEMELLKSRDLLSDVVRKAGLLPPGASAGSSAEEAAVKRLQSRLLIEPIKKSDVLQLTYRDKSAGRANAILKQLIDSYLDFHLRVHATPGSVKFFEDQANIYAGRLASSEQRLRQLRQLHPAVAGANTQAPLQERAAQAKALLENAAAEEAEYSKQVQAGTAVLKTLPARVTSQMRVSPQVALLAQLNGTLVALENRRTEAVTKFLPTDRFVTELDQEITDTQGAIAQVNKEASTETVTDLNQVSTEAQRSVVEARIHLAGITAKRAQLQSQLANYQKQRAEDAGAAIDDESLARIVKEDEENYLLYARKREEAAISKSLDQQRITDVSVVEHPTYSSKPVSPQVTVDIMGAFLFSCLAGYLSVLWAQYRAESRATQREYLTTTVGVGN